MGDDRQGVGEDEGAEDKAVTEDMAAQQGAGLGTMKEEEKTSEDVKAEQGGGGDAIPPRRQAFCGWWWEPCHPGARPSGPRRRRLLEVRIGRFAVLPPHFLPNTCGAAPRPFPPRAPPTPAAPTCGSGLFRPSCR